MQAEPAKRTAQRRQDPGLHRRRRRRRRPSIRRQPLQPCRRRIRVLPLTRVPRTLLYCRNLTLKSRHESIFMFFMFIEPQGTHTASINQPPPPFQTDRPKGL